MPRESGASSKHRHSIDKPCPLAQFDAYLCAAKRKAHLIVIDVADSVVIQGEGRIAFPDGTNRDW
jgi:ATP adenylyltransferase/5',5'''-P-1,P-4-tetraphosphate phosphorylase II